MEPWALMHEKHSGERRKHTSLRSLLEISKESKCQDKRDKVYGLLGLASDMAKGEIAIDYSQSLYDLYVNVMNSQIGKATNSHQLIVFSSILQKALLGPDFHITDYQDISCFEELSGLAKSSDMNCVRVSGRCLGEIALVGADPNEIVSEAKRSWPKKKNLKQTGGHLIKASILESWRRVMTEAWKEDRACFPLFIRGLGNMARGSAGLTMFVENRRIMGYGPRGLKKGDMLWKVGIGQYEAQWTPAQSHTQPFHVFFAVIRLIEGRHEIIGRAILAKG